MDLNQSKPQNLPLGLLHMFLMTLALTAMGALGQIVQKEVGAYQVAFVMNLVCLVLIIPTVLIRRGWRGVMTRHIGIHLIRDFAGTLGFLAFVIVLPQLALVNVMLLNNTAPLWVPFVVWVWLHHRAPTKLYWGTLLGFLGIVLVLQPGIGSFNWWMLVAVFSGFTLAVTFVAIRVLNKTEGPYVILFYYFMVATLITLPLALWTWVPASGLTWLWMVLIGVAMLSMQVFLVLAGQRGPATVLSPLLYLTIVWGVLVDWLLYQKIPNWISWSGIVLVIVGGVLSLVLGGRVQKIADASAYPKSSRN